jgi:hypothetical protein
MADLTERQRRFVEAFVGEAMGSATEAARMAGYANPENNAHRLMELDGVVAALNAINADVHDTAIATAHEVQAFLSGVVRGTEGRSIVMTEAGPLKKPGTDEYETDDPPVKDRVKAAEALAKMRGYIAPVKSEVEVTGVPVTVYLPSNGRDPK